MKYLLRIVAVIFFIVAFLFIKLSLYMGETIGGAVLILWLLGIIFLFLGGLIYKKSKKVNLSKQDSNRKTKQVLETDERKPILYLRSFLNDPLAAKSENDSIIANFLTTGFPQNLNSEEEQLSLAVKDFGPFVAVGNPKDPLPQIGALKLYSEENEWQNVVTNLIQVSQLVILRVGHTPGFWWEVETVVNNKEPEKIMFLLPSSIIEYTKFKTEFEKRFKYYLPSDYIPRNLSSQSFSAVLIFGKNWNPDVLYCKEHSKIFFNNTVTKDFKVFVLYILSRYKNGCNFEYLKKTREKPTRSFLASIQLFGGSFFIGLIITALTVGIIFDLEFGSPTMLISWVVISLLFYTFIILSERLNWTN